MKGLNNGTAAIFSILYFQYCGFCILKTLPSNSHIIVDPTKKIEGLILQRKDWVTHLKQI